MSGELPAHVGEEIAGYKLNGILGRGGMGCVFDATHTKLGRRTALKFLASELVGSEEYVKRFLSEARIVNSVRHPNIVDIYDFLELERPKRVAYVMEFIDGRSLGEILKTRRLSVRQAVNVTFQLADALEAVHAHGVVHRDLKPDNILVTGKLGGDLSEIPSVKILDFGIAKAAASTVEHRTQTGAILGTPSYMAPEQVAGHEVSAATDIYAVGEIFYEMVTGRRLFQGDRIQMMTQKLGGSPPSLELPTDITGAPRIQQLVDQCLHVHPSDRPNMKTLAGELTEILSLQSEFDSEPSALTPWPPLAPTEPSLEPSSATPMAMASVAALPAPRSSPMRSAVWAVAALALGVAVTALAFTRLNVPTVEIRTPATPIRSDPLPAVVETSPPPAPTKAAPERKAAAHPPKAAHAPKAPGAEPKTPAAATPAPSAKAPANKSANRKPKRRKARRTARRRRPEPVKPTPPKPAKRAATKDDEGSIINKGTIPSW